MQHIQDFKGSRTPGDAASREARAAREGAEPPETATDGSDEADAPPSLLARLRAEAPQQRRSLFRR